MLLPQLWISGDRHQFVQSDRLPLTSASTVAASSINSPNLGDIARRPRLIEERVRRAVASPTTELRTIADLMTKG